MDDIKVIFDETEDIKTTLDVGSIQYGQLEIGTTTTGKTGEAASVTNTGSSAHAILNFTIPRGEKGDKGEQGTAGKDGAIQYTAGTGIEITDDNIINNTQTSAEWGKINGTLSDQTDMMDYFSSKEYVDEEISTRKEIAIGEKEITGDTKLLIETDTLASLGTEVVNTLNGNEVDKAPSVQAVNNVLNKLKQTIETGTITLTGVANAWGWTHITYKNTYSSIPKVFIQETKNSTVPVNTTVINLSTTGCDVGVWNNANTHTFLYLAVEDKGGTE